MIHFLFQFFKIGLLTYGGGLAMIPILSELAVKQEWMTRAEFADLIAISQSTPGPIAINMATYIGYQNYGLLGAILASVAIVLPAFILAILLSRILMKYSHSRGVKAAFVGIKAVVIGLIATAVVQVGKVSIVNLSSLLLLIFFILLIQKKQKHPLFYIILASFLGIAMG